MLNPHEGRDWRQHETANGNSPPGDLGFGSYVSNISRARMLNRNGTFNVERDGLKFFSSLNLYHWLLALSWLQFFLLLGAFYLVVNLIFATLYTLCGADALSDGNAASTLIGNFGRAFFFSVQTFATIGYGSIAPVGLLPNMLVTVEAFMGLIGQALATGLLFARFSRPTAKFIFSRTGVIAPYRDHSAFMLRITNARRSQMFELQANVVLVRFKKAEDGKTSRIFSALKLERESVAFFPLAWTIVHPIDADSPLHGVSYEELLEADAEFLILLKGFDETFSQTVHARTSYKIQEVKWGEKFINIYKPDMVNGKLAIDIRRLHWTEPAELPPLPGKSDAALAHDEAASNDKTELIEASDAEKLAALAE